MLFAEIIRELREDHAESNKNLFKSRYALLTLSIVFSFLYIISTTIDYINYAFYSYMLDNPVIYLLSREKVAVNMQGTVFTLAILKIVPRYHQEPVPHPMPKHIEALS